MAYPPPPQGGRQFATKPSSTDIIEIKVNLKNSVIVAAAQSIWDNVMGPKIQYVWRSADGEDNASNLYFIKSMAHHALNSEVTHFTNRQCKIEHKFELYPSSGFAVTSFTYMCKTLRGYNVLCLVFFISLVELNKYLALHDMFVEKMTLLIHKYKVLQENLVDPLPGQKPKHGLSSDLSELVKTLLVEIASLKDGAMPVEVKLKPYCDVEGTLFDVGTHRLMYGSKKPNRLFLCSAISSHLQTFGCSVVMGDSIDAVNCMIRTLALFLTPKERQCSRLVTTTNKDASNYISGLFLQGCIKAKREKFSAPIKEIQLAKYPVSVVNLAKQQVKQSPAYNTHLYRKQEIVNYILRSLRYGYTHEENFALIYTTAHYYQTFVTTLLEQIDTNPLSHDVLASLIHQFNMFLRRKAIALIKCLEDYTQKRTIELSNNEMNEIKRSLNLIHDGDFRIVLGTAEKLHPHINVLAYPLISIDVDVRNNLANI